MFQNPIADDKIDASRFQWQFVYDAYKVTLVQMRMIRNGWINIDPN